MRAIRLSAPLDVDGSLDEAVYTENPPFGDLIQTVPATGQPASERTDVWLMFDDKNIYVGARVHDSAPPEEWIANEYRRDSAPLRQNDHIGVGFDTFYDRRSGFMFYASPLGAFSDYSIIDEGQPNSDWNPVWNVRTGRFDGGWTMEMIIPFKSLRFDGGANQTWGFQVRRSIRRKNEWDYLTALPASMGGPLGPEPRLALRQRSPASTPAGRPHLRDQAVRPGPIVHRPGAHPAGVQRPRRGGRPRREVRHHRQPRRRLHLQHRLRAGRGGRAAGEPDPLQPVLSREARLLPRGPRHLRLRARRRVGHPGRRRRAGQRLQRAIGDAVPLLQPAHRAQPRPRGADRGRRAGHRQGRQVRHRRAEHPGRRRTGDAHAVDQLHRRCG